MKKFSRFLILLTALFATQSMADSVSGNFTAIDSVSSVLYLKSKQSVTYSLSGFGVAQVCLQRSASDNPWDDIGCFTANKSSTVYKNLTSQGVYLRWYAKAYTSGTIAYTLADVDGDIIQDLILSPSSGSAVLQLNDQEKLVAPFGIDVGAVTLDSPVLIDSLSNAARINVNDTDAALHIDPDSTNDLGIRIVMFGASHATQANDFSLRSGSHEVINFDDSALLLTYGHTDAYAHLFKGSNITLDGGPNVTLKKAEANGTLTISSDTVSTSGATLSLSGSGHANGPDIAFSANNADVLFHDDSAGTLTLGGTRNSSIVLQDPVTMIAAAGPQGIAKDTGTFGVDANPHISFQDTAGVGALLGFTNAASDNFAINLERAGGTLALQFGATTRIGINTTGIGFFAATPVAKQGAITAAAGDEAATINAIITALENYGLLVPN